MNGHSLSTSFGPATSSPQPAGDYQVGELIKAAALDSGFYSRTFFPNTALTNSPQFHGEIWDVFERPENRYTGIMVFRGGAKTSITRLLVSKRVAYALSRFIMFVSLAEAHAIYSVEWLRKQVLHNKKWARTYGLRLTKKSAHEIEIYHEVEDCHIRILARGMTGQIRGFNIDDNRPDLIVGDDLDGEETTRTEEQREKQKALLFGGLINSLGRPADNPYAKAILLQTPLHREDLICTVMQDPTWQTRCFGVFDDEGNTRWPERFPQQELIAEKTAYMRRNQLSLWMREMECKIIPTETRPLRTDWLQYWDVLPEGCFFLMAIDPASSQSEGADFQAVCIIAIYGAKVFLVEYEQAQGQTPAELAQAVFRLYLKYRPYQIGVESISYQRVLAWYLKEEMYRRQLFPHIVEIQDRRRKYQRVVDAMTSTAAEGNLYVRPEHREFISQFTDFPDCMNGNDDLIDAVSMAIAMRNPAITVNPEAVSHIGGKKPVVWQRGAP